ncbi:hypothetical protein NFL63_14920 [Escherichia coli]|nr:hypothetical protein NFL63_14920 [Escherichia coli]
MTANKPMTGEQLDELMTVAVNMQRDSEKSGDRPTAMFSYAVQVAVLELRKVRTDCVTLAVENAGLKAAKEIIRHLNVNREEANFCGIDDCYIDDAVAAMITPATDAFLAEVRAQGVEMFSEKFGGGTLLSNMVKETAKGFAAQLRKGVQS